MKQNFAKIAGGAVAGVLLLGLAANEVDDFFAPQACGFDPNGASLVLENTINTPRVIMLKDTPEIQSGADRDYCNMNGTKVELRPDLYTWARAQGILPSMK